jgi:hydrogenase maturation protease
MNSGRILIAGVGNIFFGDDAFGVEVVRRMAPLTLPEGVRAIDFGIRGLDLAYALLDPWEAVILVDAVPRGGAVGTVYALEIEDDPTDGAGTAVEAHAMDPVKVLRMARDMGSTIKPVFLVGCEPGSLAADEMCMEMSESVGAAVEEAIALIQALVGRLLADGSARQDNSRVPPLRAEE